MVVVRQINIYLCSHCARVYNTQLEARVHELAEHADGNTLAKVALPATARHETLAEDGGFGVVVSPIAPLPVTGRRKAVDRGAPPLAKVRST